MLDDLDQQTSPPDLVVIRSSEPAPQLRTERAYPVEMIVSPGGLCAGRNAIARQVRGRSDYIQFFNDNSRIEPHYFEQLRERVVDHDVYAMRMVDSQGPRNPLPPSGSPITRRTVWGAIEPATLLRVNRLMDAGGFDESIGPGADSPWQCGEITDLLLRMQQEATTPIEWVSDLVVHAVLEFGHLTREERHRKVRAYGRGSGHIHYRWNYSAFAKLRHVVGGALLFARQPRKYTLADSALMALGRLEGVRGRVFGRSTDYRSVLR